MQLRTCVGLHHLGKLVGVQRAGGVGNVRIPLNPQRTCLSDRSLGLMLPSTPDRISPTSRSGGHGSASRSGERKGEGLGVRSAMLQAGKADPAWRCHALPGCTLRALGWNGRPLTRAYAGDTTAIAHSKLHSPRCVTLTHACHQAAVLKR